MKLEFKGTKGEWSYNEDFTILNDKGFSIADSAYPYFIDIKWGEKGASHWSQDGFHREVSEEESEANAKLIASAPDLLEALQEVMKTFVLFRDDELYSDALKVKIKAHKAIEKALL